MKASEKLLTIKKTARYYTYGNITKKTKNVWLTFHGYGQLGRYFIQKFESLDPDENYVIAFEGLNKFYLNGFTGRIGATWMTADMRIEEIKDYLHYIDDVIHSEFSQGLTNHNVYALGFSQGCHTATRWVIEREIKPQRLILWSGSIPNEYDDLSIFNAFPVSVLLGKNDELLTTMHFAALEKVKAHIPELQYINFEGGHELSNTLFELYHEGFISP